MDSLPLELLHPVCRHLPLSDVGNFRLVSKTFATVGAQYLLPVIHTVFHPDSFERLEMISRHPVFSRYVTSLSHEGDTLSRFDTMGQWKQHIFRYPDDGVRLIRPLNTASDSDKRAYMSALWQRCRWPSDELAEGWKYYNRLFEIQENMRRTDDNERLLREAMSRLPRLRSIKLYVRNYKILPSSTFERLYDPALVLLMGDDWDVSYGFLAKLLLSADSVKIRLEVLDAGIMSWRFITADNSHFARMKNTVRHLEALSLCLTTDDDEDEAAECFEYLKCGRLREFVTAAPNLIKLKVLVHHLYTVGTCPAELGQVVGAFTWPKLETVAFGCTLASKEKLLDFFERHAGTLKRVYLEKITLSDGDWVSTLQRMRQILSLEDFDVRGSLCSAGLAQHWSLIREGLWDYMEETKETFLRKALTRYFIEEGLECPLLDAKFIDCFRSQRATL